MGTKGASSRRLVTVLLGMVLAGAIGIVPASAQDTDTSTDTSSTGTTSTDLTSTDLTSTDLTSTDLTSTDLTDAVSDLTSTDAASTDLTDALSDVTSTDLTSTDLTDALSDLTSTLTTGSTSSSDGTNTQTVYQPYPVPVVIGNYGHRYYGKYWDNGCGCNRYAAPKYTPQTVVATQVTSTPKGGVDTGDGSFPQ